ncbi:MAG: hypothetical protein IKO49_00940 [Bacilli bacterium]|nr:hypothetical protein [Bacilli bacterium]
MTELETLQRQHYQAYVKAVKEIINNNTIALVDSDIAPLIKKPPLDSMDQVKSKLLALAKKENLVLETETLNLIVSQFREKLENRFQIIKKIRLDGLFLEIDKILEKKDEQIIKITKKQLNSINSQIKKEIKDILNDLVQKNIINNLDKLFVEQDKEIKINKIKSDIFKYLNSRGIYQKQLLESIDFKILVKDTTLINGIKEQADRYIFTLNNSRIFN